MSIKEIAEVGMDESCGSDSNPSDDNLEEVVWKTIINEAKKTKCFLPLL